MAANGLLTWVTGPRLWAGLSMLVFTALFVTPYCGYLFECGCTWPWAGLDADCNIHQAHAEHRCPWCVSLEAGGVSMLVLFGASMIAAVRGSGGGGGFLARYGRGMGCGLVAFLIAGFITAWAAALYTGYPMFIFPGLV